MANHQQNQALKINSKEISQLSASTIANGTVPVSFREVIERKEPNFQAICKAENTLLESVICEKTTSFLSVYSSDENNARMAIQFAQDLIETRPDWKIADVDYFFKFIRQRQDIESCRIFGNKITGLKLMELVCVYEDCKAIEREKMLKEKFSKSHGSSLARQEPVDAQQVRDNIRKILDTMEVPKKKPVNHLMAGADEIALQNSIQKTDFNSENNRFQAILRDFDALHADQNYPQVDGKRVVIIDDKPFDGNGYMELKISENR